MEAAREGRRPNATPPSDAEIERRRKRDSWLLQRTRVLHDLETASSERYREMLKRSLEYLDQKLAELA